MKNNNARGETNYAGYTALAQNEIQDPNAAKENRCRDFQRQWYRYIKIQKHNLG